MAFKAKVTKSINLKNLLPDIKKQVATNKNQGIVRDAIVEHIESGKSPVKGKRFKQYNRDYADRFKGGSRRPVNMTRTGKMLKSLKIERTKTGFRVKFKDETADYHNRLGAGRSKVIRRLLPTKRGEEFAVGLNKKIVSLIRKATTKVTKKINR